MRRTSIALVVAPLLVSLVFGVIGVAIVFPVMLVVGTSVFFAFRALGWLQWWHAGLAGFLAGAAPALLLNPNLEYLDTFGFPLAVAWGGLGAATGILFWWIGLFRNRAFPAVPTAIPVGMLALVPLAAAGAFLYRSTNPTAFYTGRVIKIEGQPPTRDVTVRLSDGTIVNIPLRHDSRPSEVMINQCWHLMNHWSVSRMGRAYSLMGPFGAGGDTC